MVAARRRIQDAGIFDPVAAAVAARVSPAADVIVDAGAGTGHYLSAALGAAPAATGIACDLSKYCARAAARAHPRALSLVADLWDAIPVASGAADAVLSVFAPRNLAETARILAPGGRWLIVTPAPGHLAQVREPLGMLAIGADKLGRLHGELEAGGLTVAETVPVTATAELDAAQLADLAGMGPAGFHRTPAELAAAAQALAPGDSRVPVTVDVVLTVAAARPGHRS